MSAIANPLEGQGPPPATKTKPRKPRSSKLHPSDLAGLGAIGLRASRVRAALTMIGIAIGIAAMVGVLVISESSRSDLLGQLDRLGTNMLRVTAGQTLFGGDAQLSPDARAMVQRIGPVESASSVATQDASVRRTDYIDEGRTGGISVTAADLDLLDTLRADVATGTWLDEASATVPTIRISCNRTAREGSEMVAKKPACGGCGKSATNRRLLSAEW